MHSYCTLQVQLRGWITSDSNSSVRSLCRNAAHTAIAHVNGDQAIEYSGINDTTVLSTITAATADTTLPVHLLHGIAAMAFFQAPFDVSMCRLTSDKRSPVLRNRFFRPMRWSIKPGTHCKCMYIPLPQTTNFNMARD